MNDLKYYLIEYLSLLRNRNILKIVFLSFLFATFIVVSIFFYIWNLAPTFSWLQFLMGSFYNDIIKVFWKFIIFSILIFLIPPLFSVIVSFFLDDIVEEVYLIVTNKYKKILKTLSFLSGIIVSIKIFIYVFVIFLLVIFLKIFFVSNNYLIHIIQFILTSYIIAKEYGELITYKLSIRNPGFQTNLKNGIICNILFILPIINIIAPILTTIIITKKYIKAQNSNNENNSHYS